MTMRRWVIATIAIVLLGVTACSGGGSSRSPGPSSSSPPTSTDVSSGLPEGFGAGPAGSGLQRFYDQKITWTPCDNGDSCASVWVPLDYADPDGQAITVKMERRSATDQSAKLGTLFFNPGGPGASGIDDLSFWRPDAAISDRYDVIGFDPRGVGSSTPVDCLSDQDLDAFLASDPSPDTNAEVNQLQADTEHYIKGCEQRSGPLLGHVSTVEVARDLDILRALVGDAKLNYFGFSYGTLLGADYAGLFPKKVGRMVLDGAIDPKADLLTAQLGQTKGFQANLTAYLQDCVDSGSCPLGTSVASAQQRLTDFFDGLDSHPLPTSSDRDLTQGLAFLGIVLALYSPQYWPTLTQSLSLALNGDGSALLVLADAYARRNGDGTYQDNGTEVQSAVACLDTPQHETLAEIEAGASEFDKASAFFGPVATWFPYICSHWPLTASEPLPDYAAKGAAPIVVVGTTNDPATPFQNAVNLANDLSSGVLLSRSGNGHTAYQTGNSCIDSAIDTYFSTGTPPADGTQC